MIIAVAYFLAILAAEMITVLVQPVVGLVLHVAVMTAAVLHAGLARLTPEKRYFVLSLALVPLVRIMSLSMPLTGIPQLWWHPVIYIPLAAATVVVLRIPGYRAADIGLKVGSIKTQTWVALSGFGLGALEYLILRPQPFVPSFTPDQVIPSLLIFFLFVGFVEEFIFRGVLQRSAKNALGVPGIVYVAALFGIMHMGFYSWLDVLFVFAVAVFFGWVVNRTGSLLGVVIAHGITNSMLYLVLPFMF